MKLLFIHGAPAAGKLTVAKVIGELLSCRLFDNHAAMDVALTVFDFGEPGFWDLVHDVRLMVLDSAARHNVPLVVMTYCYSDPEDLQAFEQFESIVLRNGGELLPVFLHCSLDEAIVRVANPDRAERGKVSSEKGLREFIANYTLTAVPRDNCLQLDTESRPPMQTAEAIIRHFRLTIEFRN